MIEEYDIKRIRDDAYIAIDALQSLICAPTLNESYVKEKVNIVERCVEFIKHFTGEKNE